MVFALLPFGYDSVSPRPVNLQLRSSDDATNRGSDTRPNNEILAHLLRDSARDFGRLGNAGTPGFHSGISASIGLDGYI
jgi:hypothetical protein